MFVRLASTKIMLFIAVGHVLSLLLQLFKKFQLAYGKRENWPLLLSHCRYFNKSFTEMFFCVCFFQLLPWQLKG